VKVRRVHRDVLSHFVLAATFGVLLLYILLILTT